MIEIKNLYFKYPSSENHILDNISFKVKEKTLNIIAGPSGSGKSTFLKALTGLIPHSTDGLFAGEVLINGRDIRNYTISELSHIVGCVFQNPEFQLFENRVADEFPFAKMHLEEIEHPLFRVFNMDDLYDRKVVQLSSGEKQKIAITSILVRGQPIILLDEPLATLDEESTQKLIEALVKLTSEEGRTIVVIEHQWKLLAQFADQVIKIKHGKVEEIMFKPISVKQNPLHGLKDYSVKANISNKNALDVKNIRFMREKKVILDDVNFNIKQGEIVGLIGPNGAGKSTLSFIIAGVLRAKEGTITIGSSSGSKSDNRKLGIAFQNPTHQLFCNTVQEEVNFGRENYGVELPYHHEISELMAMVDIAKLKDRKGMECSFGEQQRIAFAAALGHEPQVIILDEPTTGLDENNINLVVDFILRLRAEGHSFLVISHDSRFIEAITDRTIFLKDGRIIE